MLPGLGHCPTVDNSLPHNTSAQLLPTVTNIPRTTSTRTTPHQDHYHRSGKTLFRTNTYEGGGGGGVLVGGGGVQIGMQPKTGYDISLGHSHELQVLSTWTFSPVQVERLFLKLVISLKLQTTSILISASISFSLHLSVFCIVGTSCYLLGIKWKKNWKCLFEWQYHKTVRWQKYHRQNLNLVYMIYLSTYWQ